MTEPAAVIINANAGTNYTHEWAAALAEKFQVAGLDVRVTLATDGNALIAAARSAVARGATLLVAGGGDGTINAIASVVVDHPCVLGVLPLGTLNHFAKDLGIPLSVDDAIAAIAVGHVIEVDVGEVNGKLFLNNSSLGMYPRIVRDREHQQRHLGRGKWLAFAAATITALRRYPFLSVRLGIDGRSTACRTPFIFIGNNAYSMSGFNLGTRERLDRGELSVYVTQNTTRLGLLGLALHSLFGRLQQARDFSASLAREIVIETRHRRLSVATDGEVRWMQPPLRYRIRPCALRVVVAPPPADSASLEPD